MLRPLSISEARTYRECPRKHHYSWTLRYRPRVEFETLFFGRLYHKAHDAYWLGGRDLDAALRTIMHVDADPFVQASASALMMGYHERWADESWEVLGIEKKIEIPLVNPRTGRSSRTFKTKMKIDMLVRIDGAVWVVERKSSSDDISRGSPFWRALTMNPQISTYLAGAAELGHRIEGCIYDVSLKPTIKPKKATPPDKRKYTKKTGELYKGQRLEDETPGEFMARCVEQIADDPERFYQRGEIVRLEKEADEAAADLWLTARAIKDARRLEMYPRNTDACMHWGRPCQFFDVCSGIASIDDPLLFERRQPQETQAA